MFLYRKREELSKLLSNLDTLASMHKLAERCILPVGLPLGAFQFRPGPCIMLASCMPLFLQLGSRRTPCQLVVSLFLRAKSANTSTGLIRLCALGVGCQKHFAE